MSSRLALLIAILYDGFLYRVALTVDENKDDLPDDFMAYPMDYKERIHALLPERMREMGPVVDIQLISEVLGEDRK